MNGAESVLKTLEAAGAELCIANPGTSEMHCVSALGRSEKMRAVLALFEGVVTGAADGYGRIKEKPAITLLHLGPGLGNGIANLHNARRAATPIVNIVGDHATDHLRFDAPLASDIEGLARPVSGWIGRVPYAHEAARFAREAYRQSMTPPGQTATLILPADAAWNDAEEALPPPSLPKPAPPSARAIDRAAEALGRAKRAAILMRGAVLKEEGLRQAGRVQAATSARLLCDTFAPRIQKGRGRVSVERIPYFAEQIEAFLEGVDCLLLVGAKPPVSFFAYPGRKSWMTPKGCALLTLAHPSEDGEEALRALASSLKAPRNPPLPPRETPPKAPSSDDALTPDLAARIIGALLPESAILSDESATSGGGLQSSLADAPPHDHLSLTGGAIGQGLPLAVGAALAAPDRKVLCLHGDGGAMYTVQALWTIAREKLDVTTVIFSNRSYAILNIELMRVGAENAGPKALSMLDLSNPDLDWVSIARGLGVAATRAETAREFSDQLGEALRQKEPRLIEAAL